MYRIFLVAAALACGCGLDRNIEDSVTIQQGVYGQLVTGCDTGDCRDQPATDQRVMVQAPGQSVGPFAETTSDGNGVYQLELPVGDYTLCTFSCTPITVPGHTIVRFDWTSGPGGGHWEKI
jgi:hypothetical protein